MNRVPPPPNNHAWIGLAIALAAAIASLYWQGRAPGKAGTSAPGSATDTAPAAATGTSTRP
jgi:hypothetical protein